jgi:hypothetical protein
MGLVCSQNAWKGSYGSFMEWRKYIAEIAGLPPLELMDGFYYDLNGSMCPTLYYGMDTRKPTGFDNKPYLSDIDRRLPISWDCLKPNPLYELLYHCDFSGTIEVERCVPIAESLEILLPLIKVDYYMDKTVNFIMGLRKCHDLNEPLKFM